MTKDLTKEEFVHLLKENELNMYRLAFSYLKNDADTKDAVSEAILKAYVNKGKLRNVTKFKSWIMKILVNECKNIFKKNTKVVLYEDVNMLENELLQVEPCPEYGDGMGERLWEAIMSLEYEFRIVAVLFYYEEFSIKEIAGMLKVSQGTVKSRLFRARDKLKINLENAL